MHATLTGPLTHLGSVTVYRDEVIGRSAHSVHLLCHNPKIRRSPLTRFLGLSTLKLTVIGGWSYVGVQDAYTLAPKGAAYGGGLGSSTTRLTGAAAKSKLVRRAPWCSVDCETVLNSMSARNEALTVNRGTKLGHSGISPVSHT